MKAIKILLASIFFAFVTSALNGKNKGAYLKTPNSDNFHFRMGSNLGSLGNGWDDSKCSKLSSLCGYDGQRKKLPEVHLDRWGYGIELGDCEDNTKYGILDVVGYLCWPTSEHSTNIVSNTELCPPANLYEPIWLKDGKVNPNNYWANYVNNTVTWYKNHIKIWEVWNEPDYTRNYNAVGDWEKNPPSKDDLTSWRGTIFEYIRLLRITYEVAKKADPDCWVGTGGLGYPSFLDAIMRYTDEPTSGKLTNDYPAYGGAYFDCDCYHQYPQYGTTDMETKISYNDMGSDTLAKKVVILGKNHRYVTRKYGFGEDYPAKIFVVTETGVNSEKQGDSLGGDLVRRNFIIKLAFGCLEYDIKQVHMLNLADDGKGMGDYSNLGKFVSFEEGFTHIKSSSKARLALQKIHIGTMVFDEKRTKSFRESLPSGITGIVLKRKFELAVNETLNYEYIYSAWVKCDKEEVANQVKTSLDLPSDPIFVDWLGNVKEMDSGDEFTLTSTPIFLLLNDSMSGVAIFFAVVGIILLIALLAIIFLYCYKKFLKKKEIPLDKDFFSNLLKD